VRGRDRQVSSAGVATIFGGRQSGNARVCSNISVHTCERCSWRANGGPVG
jgi:hypothetical protein